MRRLSAGNPVTVENFTLIPVEETAIYSGSVSDNKFFYGSKKPKAIVVLAEGFARAYNMDFSEIPIDDLLNKAEGLKKLIQNKLIIIQ